MIAKNVGIRRARGAFILATNIDIVFSDELVQFLASRRLERGRMYRIDRYDVMSDVPVDGTLDEQLAYCGSHLIRVCAREGLYRLTQEGLRRNEEQDITRVESGIHFGRGWFPVEQYGLEERFRWIENDAEVWLRVPAAGPALLLDLEPGPGVGPPPQPLQVFDANGSMVAEWSVSIIPPARAGRRPARGPRSAHSQLPGLPLRLGRADATGRARAVGLGYAGGSPDAGASGREPGSSVSALQRARHSAGGGAPAE
jgi:hypothetical protein